MKNSFQKIKNKTTDKPQQKCHDLSLIILCYITVNPIDYNIISYWNQRIVKYKWENCGHRKSEPTTGVTGLKTVVETCPSCIRALYILYRVHRPRCKWRLLNIYIYYYIFVTAALVPRARPNRISILCIITFVYMILTLGVCHADVCRRRSETIFFFF